MVMGMAHNSVAFRIMVKADVIVIHTNINDKFNKEPMKK